MQGFITVARSSSLLITKPSECSSVRAFGHRGSAWIACHRAAAQRTQVLLALVPPGPGQGSGAPPCLELPARKPPGK